jgi:glycosyltransferase involved in cell wall biosynthesis
MGESPMPSLSAPPLVSVVIPTYNRRPLLQLAIDNVLAQTYPAIELIVVDDGSTDDTAAMVEQYAGRLTYIKQANRGGTAARNTGIRAAAGEYLTFLDHDDLMLPTKIARQVRMLRARPAIGLVHCRWYAIDKDGVRLAKPYVLPERNVLRNLVRGCFIWSGGPLIRRQCLDQVGLFDESIWSSDWDMWVRMARAGVRFGCIQEPLGCYRILSESSMLDVARTEQTDVRILENVFADPKVPADVAAVKNQAYGLWRFWLSCRYVATGAWDDARRNVAEALILYPQLFENRTRFFRRLCIEALGPRVDDPFKFIDDVLTHVPRMVDGTRSDRPYLLSRIAAGVALRDYGLGKTTDARRQLADAVALHPAMLEHAEEFAWTLFVYAMHLPVAPHAYVAAVLRDLPPEARPLERVRSRVFGYVNVGCAFESYLTGRWGLAVRQTLTALRHRPSWVRLVRERYEFS